ncbi:MAG TPA: hypothetical protein PLQ97_10635 [Myxococcota bacterium]|nr:hypothetical protein [Myxococcota bacterium]HQK51506.1 hypothetical protein [Myxococcota bacterium]
MMATTRWFGTVTAFGWLACVATMAWARPPQAPRPFRTPDQALKVLADPGEEGTRAEEFLTSRKDLLPRWEKGLQAVTDGRSDDDEVASRVVRVAEAQGQAGCVFLGNRLGVRRPALTRVALRGDGARFPCPEFGNGVLRLLSEARGLAREASWQGVFRDAWTEVRRRGTPVDTGLGCPWVLGSDGDLRDLTLDAMLGAPTEGLAACLVQAWEELARRDQAPEFRARLLQGLARRERTEAVPSLTRALGEEADRELACRLLIDMGDPGLEGLVFALRTGDGRNVGVQQCLLASGPAPTGALIPLLDHPAPRVREFLLRFLTTHRTPEGRQALAIRFLQGRGAIPRKTLLTALASFGAEAIEEPLRAALSDGDPAIRRAGLLVLEETRATTRLDLVRELAEEDPDPSLRALALEVAWHLGDSSVLALARRQPSYEEAPVAGKALEVLAFLGGEAETAAVASALSHKDPEVAAEAHRAAWVMGLQAPHKGKVRHVGPPGMPKAPKAREIACEGATARVLGKKGPVALVLPGGPGMDLSWAEPWLWDLADDGQVALVSVQGESPEAQAGLASPEQVRCLADLLGADRVMLVSAGVGGTWAWRVGTRMPERVAVVAGIAAPLPGRPEDLDRALRDGLEEPFRPWITAMVETQQRFLPEVLDQAFSRVFARSLAGPKGDPREALRIRWDLRRSGAAAAIASRIEAEPADGQAPGHVLWVLPGVGLPTDVRDAYLARAAADPGRESVVSWDGCGFLPEVACGSRVVKALAERLRAMVREGSR